MKFGYAFLVVLSIALASCSSEPIEKSISLEISSANVSSNEKALFNMINDYRIGLGKNSLEFNLDTYEVASAHTDYMIAQGKLSHDNFNDRASLIASKTNAQNIAENVAKDYATNEATFEAWIKSPIHQKNIEGNFTHSAISIKQDAEGNYYYTQIFYN